MQDANDPAAEVREITWALIDEHATDDQIHRLEQLLAESDPARQTYVRCMQLHVDLHHLLCRRNVQLPPLFDVPPANPVVDLPPIAPDASAVDSPSPS